MYTMTADQTPPRPFNPLLRAFLFAVPATVAGIVCLLWYAVSAEPIFERCSGGAVEGTSFAVLFGLGLLGGGTYLTAKTGRGILLFFAFVLAYAAILLVLWELAPLLWGPRTCSSDGFF